MDDVTPEVPEAEPIVQPDDVLNITTDPDIIVNPPPPAEQPADDAIGEMKDMSPGLLAAMMKRAQERPDGRMVFCRGCDSKVEKDIGDNGRLRYTITTDTEDRAGDVIIPTGWRLKNYQRNPIVLFNHEYGEVAGSPPAQGRTLLIEQFDHGLRAVVEFHRKTRFNEELYVLSRDGFFPATSVGFWPTKRPKERDTTWGGKGLIFEEQDMLEWSLVAVPMNPEVYQMAMKRGLVRARTVEYLQALAAPFAVRARPGADRESGHHAAQEQSRKSRAKVAAAATLASLTITRLKHRG